MYRRLIRVPTGLAIAGVLALGGCGGTTSTAPGASPNWAGYQATAADAHYATAQIVQPGISCAAGDSSSDVSIWVGIGSKQNLGGLLPAGKTLSQVGTWAFCYQGKAGYILFWETVGRSAAEGGGGLEPVWASPYPLTPPATCQPPQSYEANQLLAYLVDNKCTEPIAPGDRLSLTAQVATGKWANLGAYDFNTQFQLNTTQTFTGAEANAANWIVEGPSVNGHYAPLANFGQVTFSNCQGVSNSAFLPIGALGNVKLHMISDLVLPVRATPTDLAAKGTRFSVTWQHS